LDNAGPEATPPGRCLDRSAALGNNGLPPHRARKDAATLQPAEILPFSFGSYEAEFHASAEGDSLVIALTGVGNLKERLASFEFVRTFSGAEKTDAIFIRDQDRSWYTNPEGWDALVARCQEIAGAKAYAAITLVGASMGGFGALRLARHFTGARVVALAPVFSTDILRHGRFIARYKGWIDAQSGHVGEDCAMHGDPERYLVLFGDLNHVDLINCRKFHEAGWPNLFVCPGAEHNLGKFLKEQRRSTIFNRLLVEHAPLREIAAATGSYLVFDNCQALNLLRAKELLFQGEFTAAERLLHYARIASPGETPTLMAFHLLWLGLTARMSTAAAALRAMGGRSLSLPLEDGCEVSFFSSEARRTDVAYMGPVVRCVLRGEALARRPVLRMRLHAPGPRQHNRGADTQLKVLLEEGGEFRLLAASRNYADALEFEIPGGSDTAEFFLRRACFTSAIDAHGGEDQTLWAMTIRDFALLPPEPA
jgi:pimeloyl-ACP methyl ester carboxylesterase